MNNTKCSLQTGSLYGLFRDLLSNSLGAHESESQNVRHPARVQNMQISTVDVTRYEKLSSHEVILEEFAKEWEVFCYQSSLQAGSPYGLFRDLLSNSLGAGERERACNGPCRI